MMEETCVLCPAACFSLPQRMELVFCWQSFLIYVSVAFSLEDEAMKDHFWSKD